MNHRPTPTVLLAGGNPQIPKGDGEAPVKAYLDALPGWKQDTGRALDVLIVRTFPGVSKSVRWNSPLYGIGDGTWFLAIHALTRAVKVTFFRGTHLTPLPPGGTPKSGEARWIDLPEGPFDEVRLAEWIRQAAALPGWRP